MVKYFPQIAEILYLLTVRFPLTAFGLFKGNLVKVHWGRGLNNFGDCLQPYILKHYGFTPVYSQLMRSDIVLAGSIMQWIPNNYRGIIMGTGGDDVSYDFPLAKIIGVRGYKTLKNIINLTDRGVVGDPGLIMNKVFPEVILKKYQIGIVPHFVDKHHSIINAWATRYGEQCLVIDVLRSPSKVIKNIKSCQAIVSSSLHGLIIADAFDIPNHRFVIRDTMPTNFFDYKFDDYYSSLNVNEKPLEVTGDETLQELLASTRLYSAEVRKIQQKLDLALKDLPFMLRTWKNSIR